MQIKAEDLSTSDWIAIIVGAIAFFGVGIAIYQLYQNTKIHKKSTYRRSVEVAVNLARHFQENLISKVTVVLKVYERVGIKELIGDNISAETQYKFNKQEALEIFGREKLSEFIRLRNKIPNELRQNTAEIFSTHPDYAEIMKNPQDVERQFYRIRNETLNTLEWMAMLINTDAADSAVIFQSLHQVILRCVRSLYFDISFYNDALLDCDKLYCNVINLYTDWSITRNKLYICQNKAIQSRNDKIRKIENAPGAMDGTHVQRPKKAK